MDSEQHHGAHMVDHSSHEGHSGHHNMESEMPIANASADLSTVNYVTEARSHDHGAHAAHAAHGHHQGGMHSMMAMTFHGGCQETILFSWWKVTEVGEFVGSFLAIFLMALLYEGLKYYRKHLLWKTYTGLQYCAVSPPDKGVTNICAPDDPQAIQAVPHVLERNISPTMLSRAHGWQTLLHALQVLVSYALMLVFMTYNTWLCLAVVLGSATGYFLFGWRESVVVDFTEHCH